MKNLIFFGLFVLVSAVSSRAQVLLHNNGATIHNNGAMVYVAGNTENNGTINNLGKINFNGNYFHNNAASLITNQAANDTIFCSGNWNVILGDYDGSNDFSNAYQGTLVFNGTSSQNISENAGNSARTVHNIVFSGSSVKNINGTITVRNNINLQGAIVASTIADTFGLVSNGTLSGSFGPFNHINGTFYREGHTVVSDLFYPIGDGVRYRPAVIKNLPVGVPPAVIGIQHNNGAFNGSAGLGVHSLINTRNWRASLVEGDYQGAKIELFYGSTENVTDMTELIVAQSDAYAGIYSSLDQSATSGTVTSGTVTSEFNPNLPFWALAQSANMRANAASWLEGPYNAGTMNTTLYTDGELNIFEYGNVNPMGINMLEGYPIPTNAIDVISLVLRSSAAGADLDTAYAWIMSDGSLRDFASGTKTYATFKNAAALTSGSSYYLIIRHRNHLEIMSSVTLAVDQNTTTPQNFNLKDIANIYGGGARILAGVSTAGLYAGNAETILSPKEINALDLSRVGNDAKNVMPTGYISTDVTLDGVTNNTDWTKTSWANDQLYFSTVP